MTRSLHLGVLLIGLSVSVAAGAHPPHPEGPSPSSPADGGEEPFSPALERRMRMMYLLEISEVLNLSEAEGLKLRDTLAGFEVRRKPLQREQHHYAQILRRAAGGDASAYPQVDVAIEKIASLREQIKVVDRELFAMLTRKGITPQQKARLALVMAKLPGKIRAMMHEEQERSERGGPPDRPPPP